MDVTIDENKATADFDGKLLKISAPILTMPDKVSVSENQSEESKGKSAHKEEKEQTASTAKLEKKRKHEDAAQSAPEGKKRVTEEEKERRREKKRPVDVCAPRD